MTTKRPEPSKKPVTPQCACCASRFLNGCVCRRGWFWVSILLLCVLLSGAYLYYVKKPLTEQAIQALGVTFEKTDMKIVKSDGTRIPFVIEVANEPAKQALGLMFRPDVPEGTGMLFTFYPPREVSFWMKNTKVSLDMLFIGMKGDILKIVPRTTPYDLTPISSGGPAAAVLEIKGGACEQLGIKVGDRLE